MTIHRLIQRAAFHTTLGLAAAAAAPGVLLAQAPAAPAPDVVAPTVETGKQPVPCVVNADAVVVRSGAGENYYPTMKLDKGAKVTVVGHKFGWLKVVPPEGSFSYIGKAFVTRKGDGTSGSVNGTEVRVRAGSTLNEMVSIVQAQLSTGTEVEIIGEKNEFFLIKPPAGAFLYVNEKYLDPIPQPAGEQLAQDTKPAARAAPQPHAPGAEGAAAPQPPAGTTPAEGLAGGTPPSDTNVEQAGAPSTQPAPTGAEAVAQAPTTQPLTADAQFDALETEFATMSQLPIEEQKIGELMSSYQKLIAGAELPESMKRIADVRVKLLGIRNEAKAQYDETRKQQGIAMERQKALQAENEELQEQIKKSDVTVFAAVGELQTSSLQNGAGLLYRLTDPTTKRAVAYIRTTDAAKYGAMIGKFVGVKGETTSESALSMRVILATDASEVDPNALYRTVAATIVPPSMLPKATANVPTE